MSTPWRTRGFFNPNLGVPAVGNAHVLPGVAISTLDAFLADEPAPASVVSGCAGTVPAVGVDTGDYFVANGGDPTQWSGWTYAPMTPQFDVSGGTEASTDEQVAGALDSPN